MRSGGAVVALHRERLLRTVGPDLLNHWEVAFAAGAFLTLDGSSNASALVDLGSMKANMSQPTSGNRPAHHATGGPGNGPYLELQGTGRSMVASMTSEDGNRTGHYVVCAMVDTASRCPYMMRSDFGIGLEESFAFRRASANSRFSCTAALAGGVQTHNPTSPAFGTGWHLHAFRPLASGVLWQIDGTTVGSTFTGTDDQFAFGEATIGSASNTSGGNVALVLNVENPTADKDAAVKAYVRARYGLTLA